MKFSKQIALTAVYAVGMAMLGGMTGLLSPMVPLLAGLAVGLAGYAVPLLGHVGAALGLAGYGATMCAVMAVFQPSWLGLAAWYTAFLLLGHGLTQVWLHKKLPVGQIMVQTAVWLIIAGMASYIVLYYTLGDGVSLVIGTMEAELAAMEEITPHVYDVMLSYLSARGLLPDVGLENYVLELDAHTRLVLQTALLDLFDGNLRMTLLETLVSLSAYIGFMAPLLTMMGYARRGEGEKVSKMPDLAAVRIPRKAASVLFGLSFAVFLMMLFMEAAMPVSAACLTAVEICFMVQGLSVVEWFFRRKGTARSLRYLLMTALMLLLPSVLFFIGVGEQILHFREVQHLKDSGEWAKMSKEYEEYIEEQRKMMEEEREERRRNNKKDDDSRND